MWEGDFEDFWWLLRKVWIGGPYSIGPILLKAQDPYSNRGESRRIYEACGWWFFGMFWLLYGCFSVWWWNLVAEDVVSAQVLAMSRLMNGCGSSSCRRSPEVFWSRLLWSLVRSRRVSWRFWMSVWACSVLRLWLLCELALFPFANSVLVELLSSLGRRTPLLVGGG